MVGVGIADGLLGRHVGRRADAPARMRQGAAGRRGPLRDADRLRDAEVRDDGGAAREQHVVRLHVPVDDALVVRVGERPRDVAQGADAFRHGQGIARGQPSPQRRPLLVRHDEVQHAVRIAGVVQRHDVRVSQAGGDADLAQEPLAAQRRRQLRPNHLDGDTPRMLLIVREIDARHAAPSELPFDAIAPAKRLRQG